MWNGGSEIYHFPSGVKFQYHVAGFLGNAPLVICQLSAVGGCACDCNDHDGSGGENRLKINFGDIHLIADGIDGADIVEWVQH